MSTDQVTLSLLNEEIYVFYIYITQIIWNDFRVPAVAMENRARSSYGGQRGEVCPPLMTQTSTRSPPALQFPFSRLAEY